MGFLDDLLRGMFGQTRPAATPAAALAAPAAPEGWKSLGQACPQCRRVSARNRARASMQLVAAVAREIVEYEAAHAGESAWGAREAISHAHGLSVTDVTDETLRIKDRVRRASEPGKLATSDGSSSRSPRSRVQSIEVDGMRLLDLRHLEATPLKLRGISHYVSERGRTQHGSSELVLKREPLNPHDSFAIAVFGSGRMLGHISASRAAQLTPLLDRLGYDGYIVGGIVEQVPGRMTQLHAMLPRVPVLRAWVKEQTG